MRTLCLRQEAGARSCPPGGHWCAVPPRVSVLVPVRDAGSYLDPALRSIRAQRLRDFDVVCVDDGSVDGSAERLDAWARADSRFRVLHRPPRGIVAALNCGLEAARADLVARFDADDIMHPDRLAAQIAFLDGSPEVDVVGSRVRHFPQPRVREGNRAYERWLNGLLTHDEIARDIFVESPLASPSVTVRRRLFDRVGAWRDPGWAEDYDLWLRAWLGGCRFAKLARTLHFWRDHPGRLTREHGIRLARPRLIQDRLVILASILSRVRFRASPGP
ncbi:MAG: glycosyltransferase family 2 protein, partial [Planctomycetota bacterium]